MKVQKKSKDNSRVFKAKRSPIVQARQKHSGEGSVRMMPSVDDPSEQEADAVADEVIKTPGTHVSTSPQRKCLNFEEEDKLQMKREGDHSSSESMITEAINSGGQPIEDKTRSFMENSFGYDFSNVKIHTDSTAARSAQAIQARAYTTGNNIVFNKGEYSPGSSTGQKLLAHELTHVVQQSQLPTFMAQRVIQRMPCAVLLATPSRVLVNGTSAHNAIAADFHARVTDAIKIYIPGASARPQRTEGSRRSPDQIDPQVIGGRSGKGFPDLAKKSAGILEVAEVKPATWIWLAEGAAQLARYVENGNATDAVIAQWRKANGISSVTPMPPTSYSPPTTLMVGTTPIQVAWCGPGLIVYKALGGKQDPIPVPEWKPQPAWDKVLFLAMIAAMAAAAKKAGMKLNPAMRAASIIALVVLLGSGKAEAKISLSGDDPLEALFKAMDQDGVTVPDDVKEMIKDNPELKKLIEESAKKGGNLTDIQKEVAKKYTEYISQHMDEFSKEELEALLSTTGSVSDKMPADLNVEDIKKALQNKIDQKDAESGGTGKGDSKESTKPTEEDKSAPKLSEGARKTLNEARPEVKNLFDAWLAKQEGGTVKMRDEIVEKFFKTIPADLSKEDSEYLIAHLAPGGTLDESLAKLKQAIEDRKKDKDEDKDKEVVPSQEVGDQDKGADSSSHIPKDDSQGGIPREDYVKKMLAKIKKKNFSKFKGFEIARGGKKTTLESKKNERFDAVFYQWVNFRQGNKTTRIKSAAVITVEVTDDNPMTVKVISSGSIVLENGKTEAGIAAGRTFTHGEK